MIKRFESYVINDSPADNSCDACSIDGHRHTISIFSSGLTGQHLLIHFCDNCIAKDSIVFETIAKKFKQKAQELKRKGF